MTSAALAAMVALLAVAIQSPAELAEKERKRREAASEKARVFTNDDLTTESDAADSDEDAPGSDAADDKEAARRKAEREAEGDRDAAERRSEEVQWRSRAAAIRRKIATAKARFAAAQARVEALVVDTVPTTGVTDPYREQKLQADRLAAADEYDEAEDAIAAAEDEFGELEEEARRARVPPGWLREK